MRKPTLILLAALALLASACEGTIEQVNGALLPDLHAEMDADDLQLASGALNAALEEQPNGGSVAWSNPATGYAGSFTPERTQQTETGRFCRDFTESLSAPGGNKASYRLSACRSQRGSWLVQ